jgi:hypothetical protein
MPPAYEEDQYEHDGSSDSEEGEDDNALEEEEDEYLEEINLEDLNGNWMHSNLALGVVRVKKGIVSMAGEGTH